MLNSRCVRSNGLSPSIHFPLRTSLWRSGSRAIAGVVGTAWPRSGGNDPPRRGGQGDAGCDGVQRAHPPRRKGAQGQAPWPPHQAPALDPTAQVAPGVDARGSWVGQTSDHLRSALEQVRQATGSQIPQAPRTNSGHAAHATTIFMSNPTEKRIKDLVCALFRAENLQQEQDAAEILATDCLPIVRWQGKVDASRENTLEKIQGSSPLFVRHVDQVEIDVTFFLDNSVAIANSLLPATDSREAPPIKSSYRNMHVFLKRNDQWQCVSWQVTKVQE